MGDAPAEHGPLCRERPANRRRAVPARARRTERPACLRTCSCHHLVGRKARREAALAPWIGSPRPFLLRSRAPRRSRRRRDPRSSAGRSPSVAAAAVPASRLRASDRGSHRRRQRPAPRPPRARATPSIRRQPGARSATPTLRATPRHGIRLVAQRLGERLLHHIAGALNAAGYRREHHLESAVTTPVQVFQLRVERTHAY